MADGKTAIVLFNLGGPDGPEAVEPFLYNLFRDPAIIAVPQPLRWLLAKLISRRRAPIAREIYANLGGASPLLELTREQATALETALAGDGVEAKCFVAMRYWHPLSPATVAEVKAWGPDRVVLLPLYPQYSTTTSGSSIREWHRAAKAAGLAVETRTVCCFPVEPGLIAGYGELVREAYDAAAETGIPRVLFSAHGLPKKVIAAGDPYQWQVERTAEAVAAALAVSGLDWRVCYQSQVGPLEWIGPSTEDEIARAGEDRVPLVVVPIAFVSEHSETLVELDIEYRELADEKHVPAYHRVPAIATQPDFIAGLARLVREALACPAGYCPPDRRRLCPASFQRCPIGPGTA